jgi:hypothetical protein
MLLGDATPSYDLVVQENVIRVPVQVGGLSGLGDIDFSLGGHALAGLANVPNWALYAGLGITLYLVLSGHKRRRRKPKNDESVL